MVDGAYQVGPAPPFRRFDVCFRARSLFQEEELPNPDQRTPAEWEAQVVLAVRLVDRRLRAEEGPQVADVVVPHGGIGGVRKRRIVGRTVGRPALAQRLDEVGLRPGSDAMFPVRRAIGAVKGTERRYERPSAGERRSEEHTSELQSLMRLSNAGFCVKKKNN